MRKDIHCPLTNITVPIIVGPYKDMIQFIKKNNKEADIDWFERRLKKCEAMVAETKYRNNDTWVVFFRWEEQDEGISYQTVAHESFHLWGSITGLIDGTERVLYDPNDDEHYAYHFEQIFDRVLQVVIEADRRKTAKKE